MNAEKIVSIIIVIFIISILFIACTNPLAPADGTALISINTGLNISAESSKGQTDVVSFKLTISADDMTTIEQTFTEPSFTLELEAGADRTFKLDALDADGNVLYSGSKTIDLTAGQSAEITIKLGYAGFYVSLVTNCGTELSVQYVEKDDYVSIPLPLTKTGYTFIGWYTDEALTEAWVLTADTVAADMTLHAKWTANTYSIIFDGNGATGGSMPNQAVDYDQTVALSSLGYTHSTLNFAGWTTENDGSGTLYSDQNNYTHLTDGNITLYAKWTPLARWTFDGTINDEAGGYNATGSPVYSASNPGKGLTQSIYFDGTHMLAVPAIDLGGQFSLSVWVNFSGGSTINTIFSNNSDEGQTDGFKLYINYWETSDRSLRVNTGNGVDASDVASNIDIMPTGTWHHLVFLVDKTNGTSQIYLDNASVASGAILNNFTTNTDLKIGGIDYSVSGTFFFNGYMSDLRLYSGILDPAEITAIYNE